MSLLSKPVVVVRTASTEAIDVILSRRSNAALVEPGPTAEQLAQILRAGTTVPDHGALRPYRFLVSEGAARERVGDALVAAMREARPDASPEALEKVKLKAFAAPLQVLLIASPRVGHKIAEWEQLASASCTGYAVALAAHALGLGAAWKNVPFDRGQALCTMLGLLPHERLLGWINIGHIARELPAATPVDLATVVSVLTSDGIASYEAPSK